MAHFTRKDADLIANQCIDKNQINYVDIKFFVNTAEFEANKLLTLIRFYIALDREIHHQKF
jgi:hypothetical protein